MSMLPSPKTLVGTMATILMRSLISFLMSIIVGVPWIFITGLSCSDFALSFFVPMVCFTLSSIVLYFELNDEELFYHCKIVH